MYTTSYTRKKGKYYHVVFEYVKKKGTRKKSLSRTTKSEDKEVADSMLDDFVTECMRILNIDKKYKPKNRNEIIFNKDINLYNKEISFCDFICGYIKMRRKTIEDDTYSGYESIARCSLIPYFYRENKKLKEIEDFDIEKYYYHELNYRNISPNTVLHYHYLLSLVFKYALRHKIISINPLDSVEKPKKKKYVAEVYNAEEINILLDLLKREEESIYFGVLMAAYFGLRRSEVIGLKWSSINFEENTITIMSTVKETNIDGKHILVCQDKTKSPAGLRSFSLPIEIKELLLKIKEKQEENKKYLGKCYYMEDKEYIYVDDGGKRLRPNYLTTRFGKFLKKFNLKHIRFHDLRHSCATILYDNNAGIKEIQTYLGHSSVKTTMEIYVHLMNRNDKSVVDVLGKKLKI